MKKNSIPRLANGRYAKQKSGGPASGMKASGIPKNSHPPLEIRRARNTRLIPIPKDIKTQNELAEGLIEWAGDNKHLFTLNKYPLSKGYNPYKFFNIAKTNDYFKEALSFARYIIMDGMLEMNLKESSTFTANNYRNYLEWWDKHYAEHNNKMIERRKKGAEDIGESAFKVVYMEKVTSDVKPRKKDEE